MACHNQQGKYAAFRFPCPHKDIYHQQLRFLPSLPCKTSTPAHTFQTYRSGVMASCSSVQPSLPPSAPRSPPDRPSSVAPPACGLHAVPLPALSSGPVRVGAAVTAAAAAGRLLPPPVQPLPLPSPLPTPPSAKSKRNGASSPWPAMCVHHRIRTQRLGNCGSRLWRKVGVDIARARQPNGEGTTRLS